jgi:TolB-like protein
MKIQPDLMADRLIREGKHPIPAIKGLCLVRGFVVMVMSLLCVFGPGIAVAQQTAASRPYTGDGGKGLTIVVPAPVLQNHSASDTWMPQLFQDTITGDLVRYSAMTVIDRANEQLVLAEQSISASGNYSDGDYIKMGNLTNAQYIVTGKITKIAGNYSVSFRINHTETNEIKTAFDKTYPLKDIETGLAPKEAVRELLAGMEIQLTEEGEKSLLAIPETQVRATAQLAKGMAAEKNGEFVEALAHLIGAQEADPTMREASVHIQNFSGAAPTGSIRERAEWAIAQKEKWEKIFKDLEVYLRGKLPVFIYDFSVIEDTFDSRSNEVTITVSPGVKVIPDRTVLLVYKTILDNWYQISRVEGNKGWANEVRGLRGGYLANIIGGLSLPFSYAIGLYDDYGDRIANLWMWEDHSSPSFNCRYSSSFQVLAQHKYYDDKNFRKIRFKVPLNKITETITPKIERIYLSGADEYSFFTAEEWQEWLASQSEAGN